MYEDIVEQASKFDAKFKEYHTPAFSNVAFDINAPHEDQHIRTPMTLALIEEMIDLGEDFRINKQTVQYLHRMLFSDELEVPGIVGGYWRTQNVKVADHFIPPDAIHIDYLMSVFFTQVPRMTVTNMYRVFQTIHPFPDGNGRVGGILLAVSSYNMLKGNKTASIIAPCQ